MYIKSLFYEIPKTNWKMQNIYERKEGNCKYVSLDMAKVWIWISLYLWPYLICSSYMEDIQLKQQLCQGFICISSHRDPDKSGCTVS
jgi:hypothetical protein